MTAVTWALSLVDAEDRVARAVVAVVAQRQPMPAFEQRQAQVLVDALHDPHVVVGIDDAEGQLGEVRAQRDVDVDEGEIPALFLAEFGDGALGPLGNAEQRGQTRGDGFVLQDVLVQQVREDHAQHEGDAVRCEVMA